MEIGIFIFIIYFIVYLIKDVKTDYTSIQDKKRFVISHKQVEQMQAWLEYDFITNYMKALNIDELEQQKIRYELSLYILYKDKEYFNNNGFDKTSDRVINRQGSINYIDFTSLDGKSPDLKLDADFGIEEKIKNILNQYYSNKRYIYGIEKCNEYIQYYLNRYCIID